MINELLYFRWDHIIPHISNLTKEQEEQLGGKEELTSKQGLYIYRADRLIVEGDWMGIAPKTEMNGLVRIEMHVPTTLDKEWDIDVKKTTLRLPNSVKQRMKRLTREPGRRSRSLRSPRRTGRSSRRLSRGSGSHG